MNDTKKYNGFKYYKTKVKGKVNFVKAVHLAKIM